MSVCLTELQLKDLATRGVLPGQATALNTHLRECAACQAALEEYRANQDLSKELRAFAGSSPADDTTHNDTEFLDIPPDVLDPDAHDGLGAGSGTAESAAHAQFIAHTPPGYEIVRQIQSGGQGIVYEAVQTATRRTVAIKVLLAGAYAKPRHWWRLEREARLMAALRHPNIVVVHDSSHAHGSHYFVMDYVKGEVLDEYVRKAGLPVRGLIQLYTAICDAIGYAHHRGVIHRDLKPNNILVRSDGSPCVLDFGLAKIIGAELAESRQISVTGAFMGTVRYVAPEQTLGEQDKIDTRTDVYALGVILYELLTGRPPYDTSSTNLTVCFNAIRETEPIKPSRLRKEIGSELDAIILKAMDKEPERRYQTASELQRDLLAWLNGQPVTARSASSLYVLRKLAAKHYFQTSTIFALLCAMVGFGGITLHSLRGEREANQHLQNVNRGFEQEMQRMEAVRVGVKSGVQQQTMGWFLYEWNAGRLDSARRMLERLAVGSQERMAAQFLMDHAVERDATAFSPAATTQPWLLFAQGELRLKQGKPAEAREAFSRYARLYPDAWPELVQARLSQIDGQAEMPAASQQAENGRVDP